MTRADVTVPISGPDNGSGCAATLHTPSESGSWPAVILYPDAAGVRECFLGMADRLAGLGHAVLLPDIYHRTPYEPFDPATVFGVPSEMQRLMALAGGLMKDMIVSDAGDFLAFLSGRPEVSGTRVGTTGYCMGGRTSLLVAAHHPDRVVAAASFHAGGLAAADDPDSPHLFADRIAATVLVAAAEGDTHFPREQHERLEAAFTDAGVTYTLDTYPAAHGFAVPDNVEVYDSAADARHWAALAELYGTVLGDSR